MTTYELIQCLAKFPPDTKVVYGFDWSDDIVVLDCTGTADDPTVALSCSCDVCDEWGLLLDGGVLTKCSHPESRTA